MTADAYGVIKCGRAAGAVGIGRPWVFSALALLRKAFSPFFHPTRFAEAP
jgi:hypothetical protein